MNTQSFAQVSPKSFQAYHRGDFDLESGNPKRPRNTSTIRSIKSLNNRILYYYKLCPLIALFVFLSFGVVALIILSVHANGFHLNSREKMNLNAHSYPFSHLRNLVMVAGHSIYTSSSCGKVEQEDSWFLEPYQKNPGQATTFLMHIRKGVELASKDEGALLLFSGGETRKDAGPRSEAQSYWAVAEWKNWFGQQKEVKHRALTEEHARDSFENLLFSICRFRELTGTFPHNITVVGYDFKEDRFANLHRSAIGYPESRFYYFGTPTSPVAKDAARKGEEMVKLQFYEDPYGCSGSLLQRNSNETPSIGQYHIQMDVQNYEGYSLTVVPFLTQAPSLGRSSRSEHYMYDLLFILLFLSSNEEFQFLHVSQNEPVDLVMVVATEPMLSIIQEKVVF